MDKYYVGLDIGTNSVGWAATDEKYNLCKAKGKSMWGIRLFDTANQAADRRMARANRRRLDRRKQRIDLLQDLFAAEISKIDETFFIRLNSSRLHLEDKPETIGSKYPLFIDPNYTDLDYYEQYPTIFHLRKDLIDSSEVHDPRLVYLALHHIIKYRGHFLIEGGLSNATNFNDVFDNMMEKLQDELNICVDLYDKGAIESIIRDKNKPKSSKAKNLSFLIKSTVDKNGEPLDKTGLKENKAILDQIFKWMVGLKGDLKKLLGNTEADIDLTSFNFSDSKYEDEVKDKLEEIAPNLGLVIECIKSVYDWSVLVDILEGEDYISYAKVGQYNKHKENLNRLRRILKKYLTKKEYNEFFGNDIRKPISSGVNYANYIGGVKKGNKKYAAKRCSEEDFYKNLSKILKSISDVEQEDVSEYEYLMQQTETQQLLPLQRSKNNAAVPRQVHEIELEKILKNASSYLTFLNDVDEKGISIADKIHSIFTFKVPYYVGPLSTQHKDVGANSWIKRKSEGYIYPWNFDDIVDREKSNKEFIRRMTNKCTYLIGEDVIAKNSLIYKRFMVLNELNNLKIKGSALEDVAVKQEIFKIYFENHAKVTGKMLLKYLRNSMPELTIEDLSGFDGDFKSNLNSYQDFKKKVFGDAICKDENKQLIEDIIEWKTIYGDDNEMVGHMIDAHYPNAITSKQRTAINKLRYSGWGNFSKKFLCGIEGVDRDTGEHYNNIMEALWNTNFNLMQLLSKRFTFIDNIQQFNDEHAEEIKEISYDSLIKNLYVSPAVKRGVWQSVQLVEEIKKINGHSPDKIFVEMTRGENREKNRTKARKQHLLELYESCEDDTRNWRAEIESRDERAYNSTKLYLYYTQRGRCMYTGEEIDIDELMNGNSKWDRDHIYPQSRVKDDSLDNLVLVKKVDNSKKSNGLLSEVVRKKQYGFWKSLLESGLITKKKFDRLTRKDDFSDDELAGFISRQIVETGQATKAVVDLFRKIYPETRIIPVKAGIVSQFRSKDLNVLKSRRINDYHHAKDAYLNIVVGDVYDARFTSNPREWLKKKNDRNYSLNRVFDFDVYRGNVKIWEHPTLRPDNKPARNENGEKYGGTLDRIRKTVKRNDVLYTEYTYCAKGELFNASIDNKDTVANGKDTVYIPLKKDLPVEKYGGYKSANTSYFALIEFDGKKAGERVRNLMEVPIYIANMLPNNPNAYVEWCEESKGLKNVTILRPCIKKNSLILYDGYPLRIRGANAANNILKSNMQLVLNEHEETIRRIEKALEKGMQIIDEIRDGINDISTIELYDAITNKLITSYTDRPANQASLLTESRENFIKCTLYDKVVVIDQAINMLRCDASNTANLAKIGGGTNVGSIKINKNTFGKGPIVLINQSITGIYENRIEL